MSPGLEKCCLQVCAKTSYQQGEEDLWELMGIKVGHSSLHRLAQRKELPLAQSESIRVRVKESVESVLMAAKSVSEERKKMGDSGETTNWSVVTRISVKPSFKSQKHWNSGVMACP